MVSFTKNKEENVGVVRYGKFFRPLKTLKYIIFLQIRLEKNNKIISDNFDLSEVFSTFFRCCQITQCQAIRIFSKKHKKWSDLVEIAIKKFKNHPSIIAIK